jgi:predicted nucleotidyltransferase
MHPIISHNQEKITELCKKHHVRRLYLFGSALNGSFSDQSDIDFFYEIDHTAFEDGKVGKDYVTNIFELEEGLKSVLQRDIDLIRHDFHYPNLFVQAVADKKSLIYAQ